MSDTVIELEAELRSSKSTLLAALQDRDALSAELERMRGALLDAAKQVAVVQHAMDSNVLRAGAGKTMALTARERKRRAAAEQLSKDNRQVLQQLQEHLGESMNLCLSGIGNAGGAKDDDGGRGSAARADDGSWVGEDNEDDEEGADETAGDGAADGTVAEGSSSSTLDGAQEAAAGKGGGRGSATEAPGAASFGAAVRGDALALSVTAKAHDGNSERNKARVLRRACASAAVVQHSPLQDPPLLARIFSFLEPECVARCTAVCRLWRSLPLRSDTVFWRSHARHASLQASMRGPLWQALAFSASSVPVGQELMWNSQLLQRLYIWMFTAPPVTAMTAGSSSQPLRLLAGRTLLKLFSLHERGITPNLPVDEDDAGKQQLHLLYGRTRQHADQRLRFASSPRPHPLNLATVDVGLLPISASGESLSAFVFKKYASAGVATETAAQAVQAVKQLAVPLVSLRTQLKELHEVIVSAASSDTPLGPEVTVQYATLNEEAEASETAVQQSESAARAAIAAAHTACEDADRALISALQHTRQRFTAAVAHAWCRKHEQQRLDGSWRTEPLALRHTYTDSSGRIIATASVHLPPAGESVDLPMDDPVMLRLSTAAAAPVRVPSEWDALVCDLSPTYPLPPRLQRRLYLAAAADVCEEEERLLGLDVVSLPPVPVDIAAAVYVSHSGSRHGGPPQPTVIRVAPADKGHGTSAEGGAGRRGPRFDGAGAEDGDEAEDGAGEAAHSASASISRTTTGTSFATGHGGVAAPAEASAADAGPAAVQPEPGTIVLPALPYTSQHVLLDADVQRTFGDLSKLVSTNAAKPLLASAAFSTALLPAAPSAGSGTTGGAAASAAPAACVTQASYLTAECVASLRARLRRVLLAMSAFDRSAGYTQGQNFLASFLLRHCDEVTSFIALNALCAGPVHGLGDLFAAGMVRAKLSFYQLSALLSLHMPRLGQHLEREGVAPDMYASSWLMTLFSAMDTLPLGHTAAVWDALMLDGWKAAFRAIIALMDSVAADLLLADFSTAVQFLHTLPADRLPPTPASLIRRGLRFKITNKELYILAVRRHRATLAASGANKDKDREGKEKTMRSVSASGVAASMPPSASLRAARSESVVSDIAVNSVPSAIAYAIASATSLAAAATQSRRGGSRAPSVGSIAELDAQFGLTGSSSLSHSQGPSTEHPMRHAYSSSTVLYAEGASHPASPPTPPSSHAVARSLGTLPTSVFEAGKGAVGAAAAAMAGAFGGMMRSAQPGSQAAASGLSAVGAAFMGANGLVENVQEEAVEGNTSGAAPEGSQRGPSAPGSRRTSVSGALNVSGLDQGLHDGAGLLDDSDLFEADLAPVASLHDSVSGGKALRSRLPSQTSVASTRSADAGGTDAVTISSMAAFISGSGAGSSVVQHTVAEADGGATPTAGPSGSSFDPFAASPAATASASSASSGGGGGAGLPAFFSPTGHSFDPFGTDTGRARSHANHRSHDTGAADGEAEAAGGEQWQEVSAEEAGLTEEDEAGIKGSGSVRKGTAGVRQLMSGFTSGITSRLRTMLTSNGESDGGVEGADGELSPGDQGQGETN